MRIISGTHRGRLITPDGSFSARPTTDFAKENLFNILQHTVDLDGIRVLDLFSGTGGISYEFASRGAIEVIAVEQNYAHYAFIRKTVAELKFPQIRVYKNDAFAACRKLHHTIHNEEERFDIVFADPPYKFEEIGKIPDLIFECGLLKQNGILIAEHGKTTDYSTHPNFKEIRVYGSVHFSFFSL